MSNNNLSVKWLSHLKTKEEREAFEKILRHDTVVLSRLSDIIDEMLREIDYKDFQETDFEDASWSHKQAFRLGDRKGLNRIKDLLKFLSEE